MASNTNSIENFGLIGNSSSEPKLASWTFMESTSNQLYPKFPNSVQFTSQGASQNLYLGPPTQSHDTLHLYQASSIQSYLKDWVSLFASSPCELNNKSGFKHGCESMGILNSLSNDPLEPQMHQPEIIQTFNFQTLPSALANSLEEVSCLGSGENHKKGKGMKNKNNVQTKGKINKGWWEKATIRGQWSCEEDNLLAQLVKKHGGNKWTSIAEKFPLRIGKQCRDRWQNYLRLNIKKDAWSEEEDKLLIALHKQFGNKWVDIARWLPGRSENNIKNHWYATKRRRFSSKNHDKAYHSLLKEYITSVTSSSSDDQINIQEKPWVDGTTTAPLEQPERLAFDPQYYQPMMSFSSDMNGPSSSSSGFGLGDKPGGLVLNETASELDQVPYHLASQLEFDPTKEMEFLEMLYQ